MESQSGIYRPSWFCRLIFRIDPYDDKLLSGEVPKIPTKNIKGTGTEADRVLEVRPDPLAPAGLTRLVLWPKGATAAPGGPNAQVKSGDNLTHHLDIAPTSFNLEYNGVRTADTFKCKFRFVDLPIDPRMIRSCGVQFYLGTLSEEQYAAVMRGEITRAEQSRHAVLPYEWVDKYGRKRSNLRFEGFADKWTTNWDDEEPYIEMECRDLTAFFIKEECPPQLGVDTKLPINIAIANYLACFPRMAGMSVEYRGGNPENVLLKDSLQLTAYSTTNGAPPSAQGGGGGKLKVWDYLADIVGCIGHTIRVEGTTVIIQRARTIKSSNVNGQQRPDDPFKSRITPNRAMIWARNIKKMSISRSFDGGEPINIEVRCLPGDSLVTAANVQSAYRRWYSGPMVRVFTQDNRTLTGTPNHPVLTQRGEVALGDLVEGDDLIGGPFGQWERVGDPNVHGEPAPIGKVFDALLDARRMRSGSAEPSERRPTRDVDFHGDGGHGDVDVVTVDSELWSAAHALLMQHVHESRLVLPHELPASLEVGSSGSTSLGNSFSGAIEAGRVLTSDERESLPFFESHALESESGRIAQIASDNSSLQDGSNEASLTSAGRTDAAEALTCDVPGNRILKIERFAYSGHVFNFQTKSGWFVAQGNVVSNCYSPGEKKTIIGRFPEKNSGSETSKTTSLGRFVDANSGDGSKQEKWRVFVVQGVKGEDTLRAIAQNIYEMISRQEIQAQIETMDLASFGGGNEDPDLLDVKAGDALNLLVDFKNPTNDYSKYEKTLIVLSQAEQFLVNLGFPREFAREYAKAYSKAGFMTDLIIRKMSIDGDAGSEDSDPGGVSLKIEAANYIEIRADRDLKNGKFVGLGGTPINPDKPKIFNDDGSVSTERTITIESDGLFYVIPTIVKGVQKTPEEAIKLWESGGNDAVGTFATQKEADEYAEGRTESIGTALKNK